MIHQLNPVPAKTPRLEGFGFLLTFKLSHGLDSAL